MIQRVVNHLLYEERMRKVFKAIAMIEDEIRVNCWNVERYGENGLPQIRAEHPWASTIAL